MKRKIEKQISHKAKESPPLLCRKPIGKQGFRHQVWCCGRSDEAGLLSRVVGWAIGSPNERDHRLEIADLISRGLVTTRTHVCPAGQWEALALTEKGFDRLAIIGYGSMHDSAVEAHKFYGVMAK